MKLTPRQQEIAELVAEGLTDKEIAKALGIAYGTVKNTLSRMLVANGHQRRITFAVAFALEEDRKARAALADGEAQS